MDMFLAEADGLRAILQTKTIKVPGVAKAGRFKEDAFLLMPFIHPKKPDSKDMAALGFQLAGLHRSAVLPFGWNRDNYIGSLPQSNQAHDDWPTFYARERLLPQLRRAYDRQLLEKREIPGENMLEGVMRNHCGEIQPALLHGDLWSGNFITSSNGEPYLIDPAVYVGHNEVDLAMTRLFGGFSPAFYEAYESVFPPAHGVREREGLYQLYYLLVHLNIFGMSYQPVVGSIISRYFR